jgi:prepilin-type N-terminal cleavage/methylation domain-containing protein
MSQLRLSSRAVGSAPTAEPSARRRAFAPVASVAAAKRGFTLIELLVVIAIIALLVSILMPMLRHAQTLAGIAACGANLHNIGIAINMYAEHFNDYVPNSRGPLGVHMTLVMDDKPNQTHGPPARFGLLYSRGNLKPGGDPTVFTDYDGDAGYVDDLDLLYCPGRTYDEPAFLDGKKYWWGWCVMEPGDDWKEKGYSGYSQCMPGSFNNAPRSIRRSDFEWRPQGWRDGGWDWMGGGIPERVERLPYVVWAACGRNWSSHVSSSELPHRFTGVNTLYHDGSVRFISSEISAQPTVLSDGYGFTDFWYEAIKLFGE